MPQNGEETRVKRDEKGRFVKGTVPQSRGGRPKKPCELRAAADEALALLISMMHDERTASKVRAEIAVRLYEWQYGKATQRVSGDEDGGVIRVEFSDAIKELAE